jgi:ATP-binding cassette subfamily B multidrug efflux pump
LYNPAILILDEATSSVDTESELLIQHAIEKLVARRTSIIIAHRLSTIRKADKILVLDKGEVKEMGSHEELLARDGFYRKLYRMQFAEKVNVPS